MLLPWLRMTTDVVIVRMSPKKWVPSVWRQQKWSTSTAGASCFVCTSWNVCSGPHPALAPHTAFPSPPHSWRWYQHSLLLPDVGDLSLILYSWLSSLPSSLVQHPAVSIGVPCNAREMTQPRYWSCRPSSGPKHSRPLDTAASCLQLSLAGPTSLKHCFHIFLTYSRVCCPFVLLPDTTLPGFREKLWSGMIKLFPINRLLLPPQPCQLG